MSIDSISKTSYNRAMNERPRGEPIGRMISSVGRETERAFDEALEAVGGSRPTWLVLIALMQGPMRNQRQLAAMVGIESATLTHHLNAMERDGLLTRRRDPLNRRVHLVELTDAGHAAFHRMRDTVAAFDGALREGIPAEDLAVAQAVLQRIRINAAAARLVTGSTVEIVPAPPEPAPTT
jgi:MarR family transcriptional regulator for hemolysin